MLDLMTLLKRAFAPGLLEWCNISPSAEYNLRSGRSAHRGSNQRAGNYLDDAKCKMSVLVSGLGRFNLSHPLHRLIFTPRRRFVIRQFLRSPAENVKMCETGGLGDSWQRGPPLTFLTAWARGQKMIIS